MNKVIEHERVVKNFLNPLELKAIRWMIRRLPSWINSDMMTILGIFSAVMVCVSYWLSRFSPLWLWVASFSLVVHWVGDSLDGNIARARKQLRPHYGFFIDHTADTLAIVLVFVGIGLSPYARLWAALLALISYLCMSIMVYLRTITEGVFEFTFGKVGPTEMRLVTILMNAGLFFFKNPRFQLPWGLGQVTYLDIFGLVIAAVFFATFAVSMLKYGIIYARQDAERLRKTQAPGRGVRRGR